MDQLWADLCRIQFISAGTLGGHGVRGVQLKRALFEPRSLSRLAVLTAY